MIVESNRRLRMLSSALTLAALLLWNWRQASFNHWFGSDASSELILAFKCMWNFFTGLTLVAGFFILRKERIDKLFPVLLAFLTAVGLMAALSSYGFVPMPSSGILPTSLIIGLYYGTGFLLWLSFAESRSFADAILEASTALVIASMGYFILRETSAWNSPFTLLALISIVSMGFFFKRKLSSLEAETHPLFAEAFDRKTLRTLVLVFSLSLVAQINYVTQANADSRAIGMLLAGSILALVSRLPKSAKSPVVIFTAVAITLCVSLFATAVLTQGSIAIAESAAMMAFWIVFILLLSLSATPPPDRLPAYISPSKAPLYLSAFFFAIGAGKVIFHYITFVDSATRSTLAALVLALTLAVAFYFIGLTSKQSQAKTSEKHGAEDERLESFSRAFGLTNREAEVMVLLVQGRSVNRIAEQLIISPNTVKTHRNRLYAKLGVHNRQELLDKYLIEKPEQT